ncbi:MAG: hypothetical protein EA397_08735 [Deltaproteobacteria bacterium]|nr:MAG: hypothetical protein EA397_08735 [Deltaproteobacteria bacterium]
MYDLIIRDATILAPTGRQVADVAVQDGRISYVGPRPPKRRSREEISAIGRFLMPGVIDTSVQFEPNGDPSVWARESRAAVTGGVTTVIAHPGGQQPVVDPASARARISRIGDQSWTHFALWGAANGQNAKALTSAYRQGLLVGALGLFGNNPVDAPHALPTSKLKHYLDHPGVLGLQLENLLGAPDSLRRSLREAADRWVHLVHLSTTEELVFLDPVRGEQQLTASVTPHHLFLCDEDTTPLNGATTVPPVRSETDRRTLWTAVKRGRLDCLASDHHPTPAGGTEQGIPGSELLLPLLLAAVHAGRISLERMVDLCATTPARIFGLSTKGQIAPGFDADLVLLTEGELDRVNTAELASSAGWSPYADREVAPKPDLVVVGGQIASQRGFIVAEGPNGRHVGATSSAAS